MLFVTCTKYFALLKVDAEKLLIFVAVVEDVETEVVPVSESPTFRSPDKSISPVIDTPVEDVASYTVLS